MIRLPILALILFLSLAARADMLASFCTQNGGTLSEQWTCPQSGAKRSGLFCTIKNKQNKDLVFNGCTGATGEFADIFFPACVAHDLCYHHEPNFSQKSKEYCDEKLLKDFLKICDSYENEISQSSMQNHKRQTSSKDYCRATAHLFYAGANWFGESSWECSKENAEYPENINDLINSPAP